MCILFGDLLATSLSIYDDMMHWVSLNLSHVIYTLIYLLPILH